MQNKKWTKPLVAVLTVAIVAAGVLAYSGQGKDVMGMLSNAIGTSFVYNIWPYPDAEHTLGTELDFTWGYDVSYLNNPNDQRKVISYELCFKGPAPDYNVNYCFPTKIKPQRNIASPAKYRASVVDLDNLVFGLYFFQDHEGFRVSNSDKRHYYPVKWYVKVNYRNAYGSGVFSTNTRPSTLTLWEREI